MNRKSGFVFALASIFCLLTGLDPAVAAELNGQVRAGADLSPLAGAKVSLRHRSEVAYSRADGTFTLPFEWGAGIEAPERAGRATLRSGRLDFQAGKGERVRLDLFDMAGKRLASRLERIASSGSQRLDVSALLSGLRGLGWLRVTADGFMAGFRVCKPGIGDPAVAGFPGAASEPASPGAFSAAKLALADEVLDTLLIEMPGYLSERNLVTRGALSAGLRFGADLWKNSLFGLEPGELDAWKAFLERPVHRITLNRNYLGLPANSEGSVVVTADGKEMANWSTLPCYPEPPPGTLRLVYTRDGREYRDTVDLAPFWAFHDSFRTRLDSLGPHDFRAYATWEWPQGVSVLPERDVLEVFQAEHFAGHHYSSFPDVYQRAQLPTIDGPVRHFGVPDPLSGAWTIHGSTPASIGYAATFTRARREGHDLRILLEWRPYRPQPVKVEFLNAWPQDGIVRADQVLRLQGRIPLHPGEPLTSAAIPPSTGTVYLEMSPKRAWESDALFLDFAWRMPWDGSSLDWKFPFPLADAMSFRLRVRKELYTSCDGLDESPALTFMPDPADTTVGAFEPNDTEAGAPVLGKGPWHAAALDYRGGRPEDVDHFRFQGATGERVRLSLRNHGLSEVHMYQSFASPSGVSAGPGRESSIVYTLPWTGDFTFRIWGGPARYELRVEPAE